jgi:hypothetical protein
VIQPGATIRQPQPHRRTGHTTAVTIDGEDFYLTANGDPQGRLAEVFIEWGKHGHTTAGLMDCYAIAVSTSLEAGAPLLDLIHETRDLYFIPNGATDDPDLPLVRSAIDWVTRRLAIDWLPNEERAAAGILTATEADHTAPVVTHTPARFLPMSDEPAALLPIDAAELEAFRAELANGIGLAGLASRT